MEEYFIFIGAGNIAASIAKQLVDETSGIKKTNVMFYNHRPKIIDSSFDECPFRTDISLNDYFHETNKLKGLRYIFLTVKPNVLMETCRQKLKLLEGNFILISVAAGIEINEIRRYAGKSIIYRIMINTPVAVNCGSCTIAGEAEQSKEHDERVINLMNKIASCDKEIIRNENKLNDIAAVSGSTPAFYYLVCESIANAGILLGLPKHLALRHAAESMKGAAEMILQTGKHPAILREEVCSPGGATIAGIEVLEMNSVRSSMMQASKAVSKKCEELGNIKK
ncbi:hypothetical protein SNEBB_007596 [Seison nebaliae]|nr:hypothetical protein SNEBB_007596 [Seison nebaliae]